MTTSAQVPVKVVFRKSPPVGGVSGVMAAQVQEQFDRVQIMAIMPYQPLSPGLKGDDMVAMVAEGGERLIVHYPTIVKNTLPTDEGDYLSLLHEMESLGGYEVEVIECTNIDHLLRRAEHIKGEKPPEEAAADLDDDIEVEDIRIDLDIINDDIEAKKGFGGDSFTEDWA